MGVLFRGVSSLKYVAYNKSNPGQSLELDLNFAVNEKPDKANIYNSRFVTLYDVYPNPAIDDAICCLQVEERTSEG